MDQANFNNPPKESSSKKFNWLWIIIPIVLVLGGVLAFLLISPSSSTNLSNTDNEVIDKEPESSTSVCQESWSCDPWSECDDDGTKMRSCLDLNDCRTTENIPELITECDYTSTSICQESWSCTEWSSCNPDVEKIRTCTDSNDCGTEINKPIIVKRCEEAPPLGDSCGNGVCDSSEDCNSCETDCGECSQYEPTCGNNNCDWNDGEDFSSCSSDCLGDSEDIFSEMVCLNNIGVSEDNGCSDFDEGGKYPICVLNYCAKPTKALKDYVEGNYETTQECHTISCDNCALGFHYATGILYHDFELAYCSECVKSDSYDYCKEGLTCEMGLCVPE